MLPLLAVFGACAIAITYAMTCSYEAQRHAHLESEARLAIASIEALQEANLTDAQLQSVVERLATESDVTLLVVAGGEPLRIRASSREEWRDVSGQPSPPPMPLGARRPNAYFVMVLPSGLTFSMQP